MESKKDRFKKTLLDLAKNENLVPGIYNYCDRWCERCTMTQKCMTYLHEQEMKEKAAKNPDEENKNFWEQIKLAWEVTMELIEEDADNLGVNLDEVSEIDLPEHVETPLEIQAKKFGKKLHSWLNSNQAYLEEKAGEMVIIKDKESMFQFQDAMEVIRWYCFFIGAKVHRAHLDLEERQNNPDDEFHIYDDNLGSAKIAIIAIERTMLALSVFYADFKEKEDEILKFLVELSSIKKQLLQAFPGVMEFKRPGFDD